LEKNAIEDKEKLEKESMVLYCALQVGSQKRQAAPTSSAAVPAVVVVPTTEMMMSLLYQSKQSNDNTQETPVKMPGGGRSV
jgi:hypothetical protein